MNYPSTVSVKNQIQMLDSQVQEQQIHALEMLEWTEDPRAVPHIVKLLNSDNLTLRREAAKSLRSYYDYRSILPLLCQLKTDNRFSIKYEKKSGWFAYDKGILTFNGTRDELLAALQNRGMRAWFDPLEGRLYLSKSKYFQEYIQFDSPITSLFSAGGIESDSADVSVIRIEGKEQAIRSLYTTMKWGSGIICGPVIETLGGIKDERAIPELIDQLQQPMGGCRVPAAKALGNIGDARAYAALRKATYTDQTGMRASAAQGLAKLGDCRAVDRLLELMEDESDAVREVVSKNMTACRDKRVVSALIARLQDDFPDVREAAAWSLKKIGDRSALPALRAALRQAEEDQVSPYVLALGEMGSREEYDEIVEVFEPAPLFFEKRAVIKAAAKAGGQESTEWLLGLFHGSDRYLRCWSADELLRIHGAESEIGTELLEYFLDTVLSESRWQRMNAAWVRHNAISNLGYFRDDRIPPILLSIIDDREADRWSRSAAARSLGHYDSDIALPALLKQLKWNQGWFLNTILRSLADLADPECLSDVSRFLEHPNVYVRIAALRTVGECGSFKEIERVVPLLRETNLKVQTTALEVLARLDRSRAEEEIRVFADSTNVEAVRLASKLKREQVEINEDRGQP